MKACRRFFLYFPLFAFAVSQACAAQRPPYESDIVTNLHLRVFAPGMKGADVDSWMCHTLSRERALEKTRVGDDGFSGWIVMPRFKKGQDASTLWYQSCVFNFRKNGKYAARKADVALEIADAPGVAPFLVLSPEPVEGGAVAAIFEQTRVSEPMKAEWFADHLELLERALEAAGFEESAMPHGVHLNMSFGFQSMWGPSCITRDPRLHAATGRLMRRLGANSTSIDFPCPWPGMMPQGYRFVTGDRENLYVPVEGDWRERCRALMEKSRAAWRKNCGVLPAFVKIGDEVGQVSGYTNSPAFRTSFENLRAALAPEVPSGIAVEAMDRGSAWTNRPQSRISRLVRYLTVRARNEETARTFRAVTEEVRSSIGPDVRTTCNLIPWYDGEGGTYQQTLVGTPDPYLLARRGSMDYPELQSLTPYAMPTGPMANSMLAPAFVAQMRELNAPNGGRSRQMVFPVRCEASSYAHVFMSALLNGNTDFTFYTLGFHATWSEWADVPEKIVAVARCARDLRDSAPCLLGQERGRADIAMLLSESTDVWRTEGDWKTYRRNGCKSEMRGSFYALRFSGFRVDFVREHMVEDGFLDGYKVLWATMSNLNRVARRKVLDWVKSGGTLVMTPGALTHDEADDLASDFDTFRASGGADALKGWDCAEFDYEKRDVSAPVRETSLGKGRVLAFAWLPGMNFCSKALRTRMLFRDESPNGNPAHEILNATQRYGVPYWMFGDRAVREKIAAVAASAGASRQVCVSAENVESGILDDGSRAFAGFANYNPAEVRNFVAEFPLKRRYGHVRALDGSRVKVEWSGTTARCTFDLCDSQALLLK